MRAQKSKITVGLLVVLSFFLFNANAVNAQSASGGIQDAQCFTEAQCQRYVGELGGAYTSDLFEVNTEKCGDTSVTPLGYCYSPQFTYDLIVNLGQVTEVQGVAGYVQAIYSLAIVFGTLIAVLMTMVAGLQWMTARGNPTIVSKAKSTMVKSITSVIILLLVVTIASIVDPRLSIIGPLRTPLIKTVNYVDESSSCEYLSEILKFEIEPIEGAEECGRKGEIKALPPSSDEQGIAIIGAEVGKQCRYQTCNNNAESCVQDRAGEWQCLRCANQSDTRGEITPSQSACAGFTLSAPVQASVSENDNVFRKCTYFNAGWLDGLSYDSCVEYAYPWEQGLLNCGRLRKEQGNHCAAYLKVQALSVNNVFGSSIDYFDGANNDYPLVRELCSLDPCKLAPPGQSCRMTLDPGYLWSDVGCVNSGYVEGDSSTFLDKDGNPVAP